MHLLLGARSSRTTSLGSNTLPTVNYTYEAASGRMSGVSASDFAASYSYDAATGWNSGVTYTSGLSSTRTADALGRLDAITWSVGGATVSGHDYTLNALNRRTAAQRQDGSSWSYGYNSRGEVTSAAKGTEPGKQFAFAYDGIGNRTSSSVSSIASTTTLRTTGYSANALTQYDSITHPQPGWLVLRGSANTTAGATVTIDGNAPTLTAGTLWFYEQSVDNTEGPVRREVEITATRPDGGINNGPVTTQQTGALFIPPPTEVPTYDMDGNLTSDARWIYIWDGENRLIAAEEKTGFTVQPASSAPVKRTRLEFAYDAQGRRIGKRTFIATGSGGFVLQQSLVHLYDGWNMIAEIDITSSAQLLRSYEWGTDISGTRAGAGGVGGLLIERFHTATVTGTYAPCYDGNGNITELVNLANGSISAHYEYGAFGETISMDGAAVAEANPFRFSTKYLDAETGLYNYGYRYYDSVKGRWLNRDPIEERGGVNLYGMVGNDPVNQWDYLGLFPDVPGHGQSVSPEWTIDEIWLEQRLADIEYDDKPGIGIGRNLIRLQGITKHFDPNMGNKFVFTCKYGWIDLYHFWNAARFTYISNSQIMAIVGGASVEALQNIFEPIRNATANPLWDPVEPSYRSLEDLQSNSLGAYFGNNLIDHDAPVIQNYLSTRGRNRVLFGGNTNLPLSADRLYNIAGGWQRLLREGGAVSWKSFALQDAIAKDLEEYKAQRPKVFNLSQAQAYKLRSNIYKCACDGNQPKPRYRMAGYFLPK